jgi:dihydroflavonol-4-reductase
VFTEEIWNTSSSLEHQPYSYSKTVAEKEAWDIVDQQSRWDMVVINPSLVVGPAVNPTAVTSESFRVLKQFGDGTIKSGVPKMGFGVVDVREVAFAHFQAGFVPQAKGRHIISGHNTFLLDMAETLLPKYGDQYPIPRREMPKLLVWLFGPALNKTLTRKVVARNVGYPFVADNTKSIQSLGLSYRPLADSMIDTFQQMIDNNYFE